MNDGPRVGTAAAARVDRLLRDYSPLHCHLFHGLKAVGVVRLFTQKLRHEADLSFEVDVGVNRQRCAEVFLLAFSLFCCKETREAPYLQSLLPCSTLC